MRIEAVLGDLTRQRVDAVVNAANCVALRAFKSSELSAISCTEVSAATCAVLKAWN